MINEIFMHYEMKWNMKWNEMKLTLEKYSTADVSTVTVYLSIHVYTQVLIAMYVIFTVELD